jgi:4-hydroxy-tetrahydrodipicolinate reductase
VNAAAASVVRTVIVGASGRMGGQLLRLIGEFPALQLQGAVASAGSPALGEDATLRAGASPSGVRITAALGPLLQQTDLVIDFSPPVAVASHLHACVAARVPMLIGTTGLSRELDATFTAASNNIALLVAPNTSLGVNLLLELVQQAARSLPNGYDIQIVETHHRGKRDAPSGTALALGSAAAAGRGVDAVAMTSVRGGDVVGEHEVWFLGEGERILLKHSATDRAVFARGALLAGQWLAGRPPGRYAMRDVFISRNSNLR